MKRFDTASMNRSLQMTPEMRGLLKRRTMPFLDQFGLETRPISFVLEEVYLQGMRDAMQALSRS